MALRFNSLQEYYDWRAKQGGDKVEVKEKKQPRKKNVQAVKNSQK
jgi:hypothetical protein